MYILSPLFPEPGDAAWAAGEPPHYVEMLRDKSDTEFPFFARLNTNVPWEPARPNGACVFKRVLVRWGIPRIERRKSVSGLWFLGCGGIHENQT